MSCVVVLGGGISGLSTTYYLSKFAPRTTKIVLIEAKDRVGGWIQSKRVSGGLHVSPTHCPNGILLETSSEVLRTKSSRGAVVFDMIRDIGLTETMLTLPASSYVPREKSIYCDHQITQLPSSLNKITGSPPAIARALLKSILVEPLVSQNKQGDESLYDFVHRRFNKYLASTVASAFAQSVCGGDAKNISVQSILPTLYTWEQDYGSVLKGYYKTRGQRREGFRERGMGVRARKDDPVWFANMEGCGAISFQQGLQALPDQLHNYLAQCENVEIRLNEKVERIDIIDQKECKVRRTLHKRKTLIEDTKITTSSSQLHTEHIVSTLPAHILNQITSSSLPSLGDIPAVDVAVVSLAYSPQASNYTGTGFALPYPATNNTVPYPGILSVSCESNLLKHQDPHDSFKMMIAMGGHQWNEAFGNIPIESVDPQDVFQSAIKAGKAFFSITENPTYGLVTLSPKSLPQYTLNHGHRMSALVAALQKEYGHCMSVTGQSYFGNSISKCIADSRMLVEQLVVVGALGSRNKIVSGLWQVEESEHPHEREDSARLNTSHTHILIKS
ncbi:hypothetical protein BDF14DRAFT_1956871 [Spinellus fusiger]|nr:hypothetical protein BDF14DRAFT_1999658 [Spinellus fusiger]KAI7867754.1 hypothetical protein BDF14DRAFT_1956871 [Spinellus fusiger]